MSSNTLSDWWSVLAFGVIGYWMKQGGILRPPLILGIVLGPIMEYSLFVTYQAYGPIAWIFRPICLVILVLAVATIVFTAFRSRRNVKAGIAVKIQETDDEDRLAGFAFLVLAVAVFAIAGGQALVWGKTAAQFPLVVAIPALFLGILALVQDARILRNSRVGKDGPPVPLITNSVLLRDIPKASLLLAVSWEWSV